MKTRNDLNKFKDLLNKAAISDFDGHTDFDKLTTEQKLFWLSQCTQFICEVKIENEQKFR